MKLSKREKWSLALCLGAVICFAVCVYLKYSEIPGVRWPFIAGAVLALVALGVGDQEWPFVRKFRDELPIPAFAAVQVRISGLPAWVRKKTAWDKVRQHQAAARLTAGSVSVPVPQAPLGSKPLVEATAAVVPVRQPAIVEVVHRPQ